MAQSLTQKTIHGIKWSYVSSATNTVLQIVYTAVMARLLDPKSFGLVAMAGVILRFGSYFAQMGMGQAIIQKHELAKEDIRAAFTASLVLSFFFLAVIWLLAPLAILIFDQPAVIPVIRVMAISFVLTGVSTTSLSLIKRELKFKPLAVINIISYILSYTGIGIISAILGFGVWSLVFATLSQAFITALLSYLYIRHNIRFLFGWKYYKPLIAFGGRVSVISFFEFIGSSLDTLTIGHFTNAGLLGIYNRAFALVNLPMQYLTTGISGVIFPSFSRIQSEKERLKNIYLNSLGVVGLLLFPLCLGISAAAGPIVLVILGEKWAAAIPVLRILALATPLNLLTHISGVACEATANLNQKLIIQIVFILILGTLFYLLRNFGLTGFAASLFLAELARNIMYLTVTKKIFNFNLNEIYSAYFSALFSGLIIAGLISLLLFLLKDFANSEVISLLLSVIIAAIAYLFLIFSSLNKKALSFLEERALNNYLFYSKLKKIFVKNM